MKFLKHSATLFALFVLAAPTLAAELKGSDAVAAINGKTFACKSGSLKFTMTFAKVAPTSTQVPFTFKSRTQTAQNGYTVKKNGKLVDNSGASRRIIAGKGGSIQIKASGRPTAKCTPN